MTYSNLIKNKIKSKSFVKSINKNRRPSKVTQKEGEINQKKKKTKTKENKKNGTKIMASKTTTATTTDTKHDILLENNDNIKSITMTHEALTHRIEKPSNPKNYDQSHSYGTGIENYDEQARLIATKPSLRSHKFIIIPANKLLTTTATATTIATTSIAASTATTIRQKQQRRLHKSISSPQNFSQHQHQQQLSQLSQPSQLSQQQLQQRQRNVNMTMPPNITETFSHLNAMPATIPRYIPNNNKYQHQYVTPPLSSSTSLSLSTLSRADNSHQRSDMYEMKEAARVEMTTTSNIMPTLTLTPTATATAAATATAITTTTTTIALATSANTANNMNVKFSIENCDMDNRISDASVTIAITPPLDEQSLYYTTTIPAISSIYTVNNFTPFTSQIKTRIKTTTVTGTPTIVRPVSALLPSNLTVITATTTTIPTTTISATLGDTILTTPGIDWRTSFNERHSSMRSIVSAYISDPNQLTVNSFMRPSSTSTSCSGLIYDKKFNSSSYLLRDNVANQIYSDVTSVRSLASIGIGSTDGQKLVIRRVPQTPNELLNVLIPTTPITTTSAKAADSSSPLLLKTPLTPDININDYLYHNDDYDDDDDDDIYDYTNGYMHSTKTTLGNLKPRKQKWANKMQFVLACIGYSVGLGNVWRFPYMCYKSGGGVFLVPYCIILIVCSIPLLFMELSIGQYTGRGPISAFGQLCPLFKGAGLASVVVSFLMSTYYSVIIGYSIYYFFTSFRTHLPWIDCSNRWNTPDCWIPQRLINNLTAPVASRTPSEEFFENKVLKMSAGIEYPGTMRWELFACLICAWLLVYFATWKSIKSSAKVRYFTATFPFVLIIILMMRAITLDGAAQGLRYFFRPNWHELKNANIWINAASQNFNSLGIAFGSMISFASYNKYNNNILRDTIAVSLVNVLTSLLVGIFAFATLGNLALEQNTNVKDVIGDGPGLIFIVYPQAMVKMPYAQLWAVMFFFMLLCLGLNSQFAIIEVVVTSIQDGFPNWIKRHLGYHEIVVLIVCVISCLFGLPNILQSGIYFFQLMDHYAASITIMFLAFCQMIAIAWLYGVDRLSKNIKQMTGKVPSFYLQSCWITFGPCLLFAIWILSLINYKEPSYHNGRYKYPTWAYGLGWIIASLSLLCIPGYAVINLLRASDGHTFRKRLEITLHPNIYECKICGEHHCEHDFPEQEHYMLQQELATLYKPQIITPITSSSSNNAIQQTTTATTTMAITTKDDEAAAIALKMNLNEDNLTTMPSTSHIYTNSYTNTQR